MDRPEEHSWSTDTDSDRVHDVWSPRARQSEHPLVLVIDDDAAVANATALLLETAGFAAVVARNATEAVQHARERSIDLLICDYRLGATETGDELIRTLRDTECRGVPAVLVSGDTTGDMFARAAGIQACQVLRKPVDPDELLELAARMVDRTVPGIGTR
jgi:DNA-binding NtrC family response regulator